MVSVVMAAGICSAAPASGDERYHHDRYSHRIDFGVAYPPPHWRGHGPSYYYYPRYYYPAYGPAYPYLPPYDGRVGLSYYGGHHDAFSLYFSLPLYLRPRYEAPPATVLVPRERVERQAPSEGCLQTREYQTEVEVGGEKVPAFGTACLQNDGSWKIVSGPFPAT